MESFELRFSGNAPIGGRAHVGVVGSGDLEVLMEPANETVVSVRTSVDGFGMIWRATLERFLARNPIAAKIEINDFGATPGVVSLRLAQALEEARR
ncbi:malonate decarboxylase subunit delta [Chenggangzhangella methanolivorans]|uniref:Malonate decarboxylase acyl carrier protein n=1 Tax=Chenggangzhangella methanolivorans TaxID=1437009 RepID=A0A9E6UK72_9HYPH|nr:malonate decarboxylase subunit delta [Chenggangzhangella methanolivorans]QZN98921.1 malonate decarboxylase subunit delta [Chenggangzhangella methanolivorans]